MSSPSCARGRRMLLKRAMAGNSFGTLFRFTTWGESHGPAIGVVVDGVPPRLPLAEPDIQQWLDKRKPGQSRFTTQRREEDLVAHPQRRVRRGDDRHADPADDREHRPASAGLSQHRRPLPPGPRRLHLLEEIWRARLSRRRPRLGARDRLARRRRGDRPQDPRSGRDDPRRSRSDRTASDRPQRLGLAGGRRQSVLVSGRGDGAPLGRLSRRVSAKPAPRPAPSSRSLRAVFRPASASRSTTSSTAISLAR